MTKTTPRRKPGPPKTHPVRILLPLPRELAAQVRWAAQREGVPTVEWIRRAMISALLGHLGDSEPVSQSADADEATPSIGRRGL